MQEQIKNTSASETNAVAMFFETLSSADVVAVDSGSLIRNWDADEISRNAAFNWKDDDGEFSVVLTQGDIATGIFTPDGKFICKDKTGDTTTVEFFSVAPIRSPLGAPHELAQLFWNELTNWLVTLDDLVEVHGTRTLADLMYLQNAILNGSFIEHRRNESAVLSIVSSLPSADTWKTYVEIEC